MTIDSVQAVHSRIAEIQQRIGSVERLGGASFAAVLQAELRTAAGIDAATRTAAGIDAATRTAQSSSRAPTGLERFENGRIPEAALTPIGPGQRLWAPAAESYRRMADAAQAAGISLRVTDSYRSYDAQIDVARRKGLYSQGGLGARPGTSSHGWGRSIDVDAAPRHLGVAASPRRPVRLRRGRPPRALALDLPRRRRAGHPPGCRHRQVIMRLTGAATRQ